MRVGFVVPDRVRPWEGIHLGVGYVAAYAQERLPDLEVAVLMTSVHSDDQALDAFLSQDWDVLGFSVTSHGYAESKQIVAKAKRLSDAKIVLGGPEVTTHKAKVLREIPAADFAVLGEGEITFYELLDSLRRSAPTVWASACGKSGMGPCG